MRPAPGGDGDGGAETGGSTTVGTAGTSGNTDPTFSGTVTTTSSGTAGSAGGTAGTSTTAGSTSVSTGGGTGRPPPDPDCGGIGPAVDELGTTPGAVSAPNPTLAHVTLLWEISGDTNDNGRVTVRYRPLGDPLWREGTPLVRVPAGANEGFSWSNKHAGSLFGLAAGTTYEVELFLLDPDGGCAVETLEVTTRTVPEAQDGAPVASATPATIGQVLAGAGPGDVVVLGAGAYGEIVVPNDGIPGAPLVLRGTAGAVVNGDVRLDGRSDVIVENLTVQGTIKFNGGVRIAVKGCTVETTDHGIVSFTRAEDAYIADNVVTGATQWNEAALGANGNNIGEGIAVTGPGHVIEHNRVQGFRDAISLIEDSGAVDPFSIDILRNDISEAADDGVEADFCFHNCRVVENRITNAFMGVSSQPSLGGPTYFVRNAMYNIVHSAFKLLRGSVGDVLWHNTVVKNGDAFGVYTSVTFSRTLSRNNLMLGGQGGVFGGWSSGDGKVAYLAQIADEDLDYDGFGSQLGTFEGQIGAVKFSSLAQMQAMTTEQHAVEVGYDVFATPVAYPSDPMTIFSPPDLRPDPAGAAVDAGEAIPGINDGFAGAAPDLGAYEVGAEPPAYGPR